MNSRNKNTEQNQNMNTKTKGDILAERIEEIIDNPNAEPFHSRMRKALADYHAHDWTLGRSVPVLTPAQIADGWLEWHGGECPVWRGSAPSVILRDGLTVKTAHAYAEGWTWRHCNNDSDIIAYRPDPYEALKKAHSEGNKLECRIKGKLFWFPCENPEWLGENEYRIKPAPVMVQLGPEDVPPGSVFRKDDWNPHSFRALISLSEERVCLGAGYGNGSVEFSFFELKDKGFKINRNDGKGFVRCEKEAK